MKLTPIEREHFLDEVRAAIAKLTGRAGVVAPVVAIATSSSRALEPGEVWQASGLGADDTGEAARWERCRQVLRDADPESYREVTVFVFALAGLSVAPDEN